MAAQPQQQLLEELLSTLDVLSEARCAIEGEAALLRSINADLSAILRRLRSQRPPPQQQAAGSSSSSSTAGSKLARPAGGAAAGTATSKHSDGKRSAAAAAAKAAATSQATRPGQQPRAAAAAGQSPPPPPQPQRLPAEFTAAAARYASLLQASSSSSTQPAAEGFMQRLQHAYGPSLADLQQQQQQQWCSPEVFAQQARFLGLVSAALWAVQQLRSSPEQQQQQLVQQLLPTLQAHCQAWLADHTSREMEDDEGARSSRAADAVRYRNRCLHALLCEQPAATDPGEAAAAAPQPPGVWLPAGCWHPLAPSEEGALDSTPGWQQLLLPPRPDLLDPGSTSSSRSAQQPPRLRYADVQELLLHSRQLQKLQQLLLQLAVESQAAPRLLELLLRGCMKLRPGAAAASQQPRSSSSSSSSSGMTHERCAALYRLVAALAAGPVKQRGLGGGCQLVQEQQVAEAGLIDWG